MNRIAAIAIIAAMSGAAAADSFAPWNAPRGEDRADATQATVEVRSYYRHDAAGREDARGEPAAAITVKPWYADDRV
ncbi:MAG: hypothetical protein RLW62_14715 [Gammaproteobacteria bacterium]